jgi:RNA recognition motif-containing protein
MSLPMSKLHINGRLYIDDMAPGTGEADLRRHFGRYGDVADIFIPTYRLTGQPRCCAFVHFSDSGDAARALADPQCNVINGREVRMITSFIVSSFSRIMNDGIEPVLLHITSDNAEPIF